MSPCRCVLVLVDFSSCSERVVRHAAELAQPHGGRLVLLHVFSLPVGLESGATMLGADGVVRPAREQLRREAEERMAPLIGVAEEFGASVSARIVQGAPAPRALSEAERLPADLIVVGSHGRTGVRRLVLGSVSEAIIRHARVPVLTVRGLRHAGCDAPTCETCRSGQLGAVAQAEAELDG